MRIGELAEQAGISTKAIRYYEQIGILAPPARTTSGYRAYDHAALGRLGFVRAAQALGLTLGEIRQIIAFRDQGAAPCSHVAALLPRPTRRDQPNKSVAHRGRHLLYSRQQPTGRGDGNAPGVHVHPEGSRHLSRGHDAS